MAIIQIYQNNKNDIVADYFEKKSDNPTEKLSTNFVEKVLRIMYGIPAKIEFLENDTLGITYQLDDLDNLRKQLLSKYISLNLNDKKFKISINERNKLKNIPIISEYIKKIKDQEKTKIKQEEPLIIATRPRIQKESIQNPKPIKQEKIISPKKPTKKVERKNIGTKIIAVSLAALTTVLVTNLKKQSENNLKKVKDKIDSPTKYIQEVDIIENNKEIEIPDDKENNSFLENELEETVIEVNENKEVKEEKVNITPLEFKKIKNEYNYEINLNYEDKRGDEKYNNVINNYLPLIEKYSKRYGLDPKVIVAIASQERGFHSSEIDPGGGIGLMQIQYNVWADKDVTAYNFEKQEYETLHIDSEQLGDLEYNIERGCAIFAHYLEKADYNLLCAIFGYNKGIYGVTSAAYNIMTNPEDLSWIEEARNVPNGDDYYLEHVLGYIGPEQIVTIKTKDGKETYYLLNNNFRTILKN